MHDYDIAVQFDGDGQHDINSIDNLLNPIINKTADFVIGSRFISESDGFKSTLLRRVGIKYLSNIIKLCSGQTVKDCTSGYRACNKDVINILSKDYPIDFPEPESIINLTKLNFKITEVCANMFVRESGVSSITPLKSIYYMIKVSLAIFISSMQRKIRT